MINAPASSHFPAEHHTVKPSGSRWFVHATCILCLFLQRFGILIGGGQLFLTLIAFPLLILGLLLTGVVRIRASTALMFAILLCCFLISAIGGVLFPDPQMRFSVFSILELLLIYALLTLEPADGFDASSVFPIVVFYIRIIAVCGIAQYALQFVHLRLFSFAQLAPPLRPFLTEAGYHTVA
ncbi:MAG: hypothetical protein ACYDD1_16925 [Caulobacteraceae bacterium]